LKIKTNTTDLFEKGCVDKMLCEMTLEDVYSMALSNVFNPGIVITVFPPLISNRRLVIAPSIVL
jgi:hypothetical protein